MKIFKPWNSELEMRNYSATGENENYIIYLERSKDPYAAKDLAQRFNSMGRACGGGITAKVGQKSKDGIPIRVVGVSEEIIRRTLEPLVHRYSLKYSVERQK